MASLDGLASRLILRELAALDQKIVMISQIQRKNRNSHKIDQNTCPVPNSAARIMPCPSWTLRVGGPSVVLHRSATGIPVRRLAAAGRAA